MDNIENILKQPIPLKMLSISVKETAKAAKYLIDTYVHYGDEQLSVMEAISRFIKEHKHYTYVCADVMVREIGQFDGHSYKWHYDTHFNEKLHYE